MNSYLHRVGIAVITFAMGIGLAGLRHPPRKPVFEAEFETPLIQNLVEVEQQWHQAGIKNDRATLEWVLADEFTNIDQTGAETDKAGFIQMIMWEGIPDAVYSFDHPRLTSLSRTMVTMEIGKEWSAPGYATFHYRDIDTFIKREGRWQVVSSDSASLR
jgi:hypothetical protein